ncbi:MAG: hypothetical protein H7Y41_07395 [Hyphomonadaceae bacterium]|nr:hypothetical protein [Clostridia bacterium]
MEKVKRISEQGMMTLVGHFGLHRKGVRRMAKALSMSEKNVWSVLVEYGLMSAQDVHKNKQKKITVPENTSKKLADLSPCHGCIWGERLGDSKFYCMFGHCVKNTLKGVSYVKHE